MELVKSKRPPRMAEIPEYAAPSTAAEIPANASTAYYAHIVNYANRIRRTGDAAEIVRILDEALQETRGLNAIDELTTARRQVAEAERRIETLKAELETVSGLLREDQLTGALNRRGLEEAFAREAARADRRNAPLCLVLLDLDDFKQLNDTYGHQAGDMALAELARMARNTLRPNDALARFGGEEFILLLPDTDRDSAMAATARLKALLTEMPLRHAECEIRMSFSAGIALRAPGETLLNLVARADEALYRAKQAGKDRFEYAA